MANKILMKVKHLVAGVDEALRRVEERSTTSKRGEHFGHRVYRSMEPRRVDSADRVHQTGGALLVLLNSYLFPVEYFQHENFWE